MRSIILILGILFIFILIYYFIQYKEKTKEKTKEKIISKDIYSDICISLKKLKILENSKCSGSTYFYNRYSEHYLKQIY